MTAAISAGFPFFSVLFCFFADWMVNTSVCSLPREVAYRDLPDTFAWTRPGFQLFYAREAPTCQLPPFAFPQAHPLAAA